MARGITYVASSARTTAALVLGLCTAAAVAEGIDIQSAGIVAPQYGAEFGISHSQQGLIFGLNNLGLFVGSILAGFWSDRIGRRWTAILSMMLFGGGSLACAFATSAVQFTLLRCCLGLGLGGSMANIVAITAEASEFNGTSRVMIMSAGIAIGGVIPGAILAVWPHLPWRDIYQLGGWLPLGVGLLMLLLLPESDAFRRARGVQQIDVNSGPRHAGARPFKALFEDGRAKATLILWVAAFCAFLVYYLINNWLPSMMVARQFSTRQSSIAAACFTGGGAIGTVVFGLALRAASRRAVTVILFSGSLVALCAMALLHGVAVVLTAVFTVGFFVTAAKNIQYGLAPLYYPTAVRGTGVGMSLSAGRIGSIVGPTAAGALFATGHGVAAVLFALVPILMLALVACLALSNFPVAEIAAEPDPAVAASAAMSSPSGHLEQH
jgi:AAHS family 3-hydroxyphenylpropionic acid transporter